MKKDKWQNSIILSVLTGGAMFYLLSSMPLVHAAEVASGKIIIGTDNITVSDDIDISATVGAIGVSIGNAKNIKVNSKSIKVSILEPIIRLMV